MSERSAITGCPPKVSSWLLRGFQWYLRRYLPKSFHTVSLSEPAPPALPDGAPLVVYLNHASWWDPLIAMHLSAVVTPGRTMYAPFDAEALARYPIFGRLGFFGVDQASRRGAAQFLRTARAIFAEGSGGVWMTPEGRFVDPRETDANFQPGLAHLVEHLARDPGEAIVLPLAIEYVFWEERLPEALCRFGAPIRLAEHEGLDKAAWDTLLHERLRASQAELARLSIERDTAAFRVLLGGDEGVGGFYEATRWLTAKVTGKTYRASHGEKLTDNAVSPGSMTQG